jgi:hypothetical protein
MFENPSAGKFDPPPQPRHTGGEQPSTKPLLRWWPLFWTALTIAPLVLRDSTHQRGGWVGAAAALAWLVAGIALYMVERAQQDARENGPAPYSERTSITR